MQKIIWTCWFQGRESAPELVRRCIASWELRNPGWDVRCLDANTVGHYIDIADHLDLTRKAITAASLSDIIRILLLHEYGGVWVDATAFCNRPLESWLPEACGTGFFAFVPPRPDRMIASWFLACHPGNRLAGKWAAKVVDYWRDRASTDDYFWFHHQFGEIHTIDAEARAAWEAVPKISAADSVALQFGGRMYAPAATSMDAIDWTTPVFKLTHRIDSEAYRPGCLLEKLLHSVDLPEVEAPPPERDAEPPTRFAGMKVTKENLGDHVQILAANRLLSRWGITPEFLLDRDNDLATSAALDALPEPVGILLNGWFKSNPAEWPPHPNLLPIYLSFHIRLFQSPTLVAETALSHYRKFGPIGCRDNYTLSLLSAHGVEAYLSHCLTLLLPRRLEEPAAQTEIFVVSRDDRILADLPKDLGPVRFINHYMGSTDFAGNIKLAEELLQTYRTRAKLIVTTLLHCALPAIAMGIPVVVFYPRNPDNLHKSDRERFSSLERMIRVFHITEMGKVDWRGRVVDVSRIKLGLVDSFQRRAARWRLPPQQPLGPIAPSELLSVPVTEPSTEHLLAPDRLAQLENAKAPDRQRWGNPWSYKPHWNNRAELAASFVPDGCSVLEIGVGAGAFRDLVKGRCQYTGADLQPLDRETIALDLEKDPLPSARYEYLVSLGLFEYFHSPAAAARKMSEASDHLVVSYCCLREDADPGAARETRKRRGWVNDFTEAEFVALFVPNGLQPVARAKFNSTDDLIQWVFAFSRPISSIGAR